MSSAMTDMSQGYGKFAEKYCKVCQKAGRFIGCQLALQRTGKARPDDTLLLGNLETLQGRTSCVCCQSILVALTRTGFASYSSLGEAKAQLIFGGSPFHIEVSPKGLPFSGENMLMLRQTEPADVKNRLSFVDYYRALDLTRIDLDLIRGWIQTCDGLHSDTFGQVALDAFDSGLLWLYLVDLEHECLVKVATKEKPRYIALSYVWGRVDMLMTLLENLDRMKQPRSLSFSSNQMGIPKTIRDAMYLAAKVGVRYLWTDSLCIIQDDPSTKTMFINAMASIYAGSYFTVVAAQGEDCKFGLPGLTDCSQPRKFPCHFIEFPGQTMVTGNDLGLAESSVALGTRWTSRGWTYQEAFLSRRLLLFNGTVSWFCHNFRSDEWLAYPHGHENTSLDQTFLPCPSHLIGEIPSWPDISFYVGMVEEYNVRDLTFDDDAVAAFAGVISVLNKVFDRGFHFGLPEMFFDVALLWEAGSSIRERSQLLQRRASLRTNLPSWSWMSTKGRLDLNMWTYFAPEFYKDSTDKELRPLLKWDKVSMLGGRNSTIEYSSPVSSLPPGWSAIHGGGANYRHDSQPGKSFNYPFPISQACRTMDLTEYGTLLHFTAKRASLLKGEPIKVNIRHQGQTQPVIEHFSHTKCSLRTSTGEWAGILSSDCGDFDSPTREARAQCKLVEISECYVSGRKSDPNFHLMFPELEYEDHPLASPTDRVWQNYFFYNVLWIELMEGVAYRRGIGRVIREIWRKLDLETVDLFL
ncbi:heterokaryon incompatibility protein-domain-containing protein, partial [Lineolata rhizophorae]